jgi:hypothetical protein
MTFTEEDAKDDGKIKDEASTQMKSVASREKGQIYKHFQNVCEEIGIDPGVLLVDMAIRALESEDYANQILSTEVTLKQARINDIRKDDLEFVREIHDMFDDGGSSESKLDQMISQQIEQKMQGGPMMQNMFQQSPDTNGESGGDMKQVQQTMQQMANQMRQMQERIEEVEGSGGQTDKTQQSSSESKTPDEREEDIDGLFGDDDNNGNQTEETEEEEQREQTSDSVEMGDEAESQEEDAESDDFSQWDGSEEDDGESTMSVDVSENAMEDDETDVVSTDEATEGDENE